MEIESEIKQSRFKRICVFCGSSQGKKSSYQDAAIELGKELVFMLFLHYYFSLCCFWTSFMIPIPLLLFDETAQKECFLGYHFLGLLLWKWLNFYYLISSCTCCFGPIVNFFWVTSLCL